MAEPLFWLKRDDETVGLDSELLQRDERCSSQLSCVQNRTRIALHVEQRHNQRPGLQPNPCLVDDVAAHDSCRNPFQLVRPIILCRQDYFVIRIDHRVQVYMSRCAPVEGYNLSMLPKKPLTSPVLFCDDHRDCRFAAPPGKLRSLKEFPNPLMPF